MPERKYLNSNWEFRLSPLSAQGIKQTHGNLAEKWMPAEVPGTVHTDLLNNGVIPDPFYSDNEEALKWIDQCDWEYRTTFSDDSPDYDRLVFDGIDTIADVYLNDSLIYKSASMFLKHSIDVIKHIKAGDNELKLIFKSAKNSGIDLENKYGKLPVELESYRVYLRKAQYSFGWDWGPSFPTSGIWKRVYLEKTPQCKLSNVKLITQKIEDGTAHVEIHYDLEGDTTELKNILIQIEHNDYIFEERIKTFNKTENRISVLIENTQLWYPNGNGEQNLYLLNIAAENNRAEVIDSYQRNIGIRTVELQLKHEDKSVFRFIINGKPVYINGVNWIPADSFLPRIDDKKYEKLLTLARDANVNMVRVWGGGIYESDKFYETCDKLGLLVWQDFMFACAAYPEYDDFIKNVRSEIKYQVDRLVNHPSIALWCGNNENEWIWNMKHKSPLEQMPGYNIFHKVIPEILADADSSRPYWPSSPFGYDEDPNSFNSGNTHQWMIWSHWVDYEKVVEDESLFVTEFGFQGPANIDTLNSAIPEEARRIDSGIFKHHNKQVEGPERVDFFLKKHLPVKCEWEDYMYLSQLNQGLALKTCLEHWRTNGRTDGSIIWQLNDCWPVTSWSIVDSELNPKLSYHFVKNIFAPCIISFSENAGSVDVNIHNMNANQFEGTIDLFTINIESGSVIEKQHKSVSLKGYSGNTFTKISGPDESNKNIVIGRLFDIYGKFVHENYFKVRKWKNYRLAQSKLKVSVINDEGRNQLKLASDYLCLFVDPYSEGIRFSKRGFLILPGEEVSIPFMDNNAGVINESDITIFSLNNYLS